jgi:hypothetical protein
METVWEALATHVDVGITTYNPGLHSFAKNATVDRAYQFSSIDLSRHERRFKTFLQAPNIAGKKIIFDTRNSYPEGFGVGNLAHPDLVYLTELDGKLFDLRVLVMYRDPTTSVLSAVRRFKVQDFQYKNYEFQARAVQESLTVINNGLSAVACGKTMLLQYEELLRDPGKFSSDLAKLVGVSNAQIRKCTGDLHPPEPKPMQGDMVEMASDLNTFFEKQRHMWPLLTGEQPLPPLSLPATNSAALIQTPGSKIQKVIKQPVSDQNYLRIKWHTNLGFNNMRFILENSLYLSQLIGRRLMVAPRLRMRKCIDPVACAKTKCIEKEVVHKDENGKEVKETEFWCPINDFVAWGPIKATGAVIIQNEETFLKTKTMKTIKGAYHRMFSKQTLALDHVPDTISKKLNQTGQYPEGAQPQKFSYWRFHLGCELSYFEVKKETWDSRRKKDAGLQIYSVADEYNRYTEQVLFLAGIPHFIGLTPTFWGSREALEESRAIWDTAVMYHPAIEKIATTIQTALLKETTMNTFICVHLRRGDFETLQWLGKAADLDLVKQTIEHHRHKGESIYMATDESNATVLEGFRKMGVRTWADFSKISHEGSFVNYLGFEDYVGLVEQTICSAARTFIGSKCSSFTGGILNLRRKKLGDTRFLTTGGEDLAPGQPKKH